MCRECMPMRNRQNRYFGSGCCCGPRRFYTSEEEIEMLKDYIEQLQREIAGVEKRIEELWA